MSDNLCKNSFLRKYKNSKQSSLDIAKINPNESAIFNFIKIFTLICDTNTEINLNNHVAYLNVLVYLSQELLTEFQHNSVFMISIYSIIKFSLWNDSKFVRTASLRCLRYYLLNNYHMDLFLKMRFDFLIMRSLDLSYEDAMNNQYRSNDDAERIQAMRLLYRLSLMSPKKFPFTLINSLTIICMSASENSSNVLDLAVRPALLILCQILILHPNLSSKNEILQALQTVIFNQDGKPWALNIRIIEAVLLTQLKLITHASWRSSIPLGYFNKSLTPFSILSKVQSDIAMEPGYFRTFTNEQSEFESTAINILVTLLQSWSGLLYLFGSNKKPILSLTGLLEVGCSSIRGRILELLFKLFDVFYPPPEVKDFVSCIKAMSDHNSGKNRSYWNLEDEFLVGQCNDCLPHISGKRINIIDNYQAVLLGIFVQSNLFEALESAVSDSNESISARAGLLLANISYKVSILMPADHPLSNRSDASVLFNNPKSQKALLWIHQIQKILEQNQFEITPFLAYIIQQQPNNNVNEFSFQSKRFLQPANIEEILDSCCSPVGSISSKKNQTSALTIKNHRVGALLEHVVRYSHIFDTCNEKTFYDYWDWELLLVFSRSLVDTKPPINLEKESLSRVLKTLLKFFEIKSGSSTFVEDYNKNNIVPQFANLPMTWKYSSNAAFVITDIICYLVESSKEAEFTEELNSFLSTIHSSLKDCLISMAEERHLETIKNQFLKHNVIGESTLFTEYDFNYKCCSYLILAIGRMSASDIGEILLEKSGLVEIFKMFLDYSRSDVITKLILGSLDYTRPALGRILLSIAIRSENLLTRRYSTKFLKVLLRAKVPFFANWGISLLMKQLHDGDAIVKQTAFDILQEASDDEVVVNNLSVESLATLHLDFSGYMLFSRLLSLTSHFDKLNSKNAINFFLDTWKQKYNLVYCETVDSQLMEYFTNYEIPKALSDDPDDNRLSNKIKCKPTELILLAHPYGSISEHKDGMDLLIKRGDLHQCLNIIIEEWKLMSEENLNDKKFTDFLSVDNREVVIRANMLAVCHVATNSWGLQFMIDNGIPLIISQLTQHHPSLNIRGTGLLCLGLLGSTRRGADILFNYDWLSLRSDRRDKWPLLLDVFHNVQKNKTKVKKQLQTNNKNLESSQSNKIYLENNDTYVGNSGDNVSVGYSVFAISLTEEEKNNRKFSYPSNNIFPDFISNDGNFKSHSKSIDDSLLKCRTSNSSSTNNTLDGEQQIKVNKFISHRREFSAGATSMFSIHADETQEAFSPHDVMGIATMRRLQRKSRYMLFQRNHTSLNDNKIDCNDQLCCDQMDQSLVGLFSNIRKPSSCISDLTKRRKKLSSLLNPRSNLNKYRGLVLPINFNDLCKNIFQTSGGYNGSQCECVESFSEFGSDKVDNKSDDFTKESLTLDGEQYDSAFEVKSTSRSIPLEESSCVLDIALLANDLTNRSRGGKKIKPLRSSSDEQPRTQIETIYLRPRATTAENFDEGINESFSSNIDGGSIKSIGYHVLHFRDSSFFTGDHLPSRHESLNGLIYHGSGQCLYVCCLDDEVTKDVIDFRQNIMKSVGRMLNISSKTKKMELNLAKLKASKDRSLWADPCLYSEICIFMSLYNFSRQSRQYLQELFLSLPMKQLKDDMKICLHEFSKETNIRSSFSTRL